MDAACLGHRMDPEIRLFNLNALCWDAPRKHCLVLRRTDCSHYWSHGEKDRNRLSDASGALVRVGEWPSRMDWSDVH